ncbi:conserved Plasmodium protein, unknown function [Plasmodium knowlesi strain H]|uniref:Uncharacterized protein n=3 Tax=Plasmodium knowlesi TaxID=5850 RepID=A0A5K1VHN3_PLAKH|nr:conserved protein, unknown function [Plasmodium knowlesi strain H]OTN64332.1 Uncharacterized protein PKNOH_S130174800 [Plasmodium knowlesi]CAA9988916.1 conserved protein, unknown function [Plasmodium knowlesi strain H]SBO24761.1 conserved Plasmodium protein, unknown function [Plasmodium knowlesi strain H]SBO28025.1 conserved Plasmodium protein, unknown function [Plasmodium knowlesi strain H]VVS78390.1 conserved protein, unknown function [Plasmodium knowlesi strain H]|eukprot:XP_002261263.1 hypothetical protein, conserved in Plasmodium species [Plasmodium knowlesi strain H]
MDVLCLKWNDKMKNLRFKINKLRNDIDDFKRITINTCIQRNKKVSFSNLNNNMQRRELISMNNYEVKPNLKKINNCNYVLRDDKCSNIGNVALPLSKNASNRIIKTNDAKALDKKISLKFTSRNKRKNEKVIKMNDRKWLNATKHMKVEKGNDIGMEKIFEKKKSAKNRRLYLEGEMGNIQAYPIYSDLEVGFENISRLEDEALSKIKKESQDDDDIKTSKQLAEWSSDMVHKYLEETIEKTRILFQGVDLKSRQEEIFRRMNS